MTTQPVGQMILVTGGGTGFIGSHLARLLAADNQVITVGRTERSMVSGAAHIVDDIAAPTVSRYPAGCDTVVHMAAVLDNPIPGAHDPAPAELFRGNVASTMACLDLAERLGASRFVLGSSGGVYGPSSEPVTEDARPAPVNFYGHSKLASEVLLAGVRNRFEASMTLRYFMPFGRGGTNPLWNYIVTAILEGRPVSVAPEGYGLINPIYIVDAVAISAATLTLSGHHTYNVAGDRIVDQRALALAIGRALGRQVAWGPAGGRAPGCVAAIEAIVEATGFDQFHDLDRAISATVAA